MQTDGHGLLLEYVASYVPKFSDEFACEWLDDDQSAYHTWGHLLFHRRALLWDEEVEAKVPSRYYHLAVVLKRGPEYWREPGFVKLEADMRLEAINTTQKETVLSMVRARTHLIDRHLSGALGTRRRC